MRSYMILCSCILYLADRGVALRPERARFHQGPRWLLPAGRGAKRSDFSQTHGIIKHRGLTSQEVMSYIIMYYDLI